MKHLLTLIMLVMFAGAASAHEDCRIELKPRGVYYTYCPAGTLMDANGSRVIVFGNPIRSIRIDDQVRCVEPVLNCKKVEELVDTREEFVYD